MAEHDNMTPLTQLQSLEAHIADLAGLLERLQSALTALFSSSPIQAEVLEPLIAEAISQSNAIRADASEVFAAVGIPQEWADKAILLDLLESARKALQVSAALTRLRMLADALEVGWVNHHLPRIRTRLNALRQQATEELRGAAGPAMRPLLGPTDIEDWLGWFWSAGDAAEQAVDDIRERFASLATFLESVTKEQWEPRRASLPESVASDDPACIGVTVLSGQPAVPSANVALGWEASTADDTSLPAALTESHRSMDSLEPVETVVLHLASASASGAEVARDDGPADLMQASTNDTVTGLGPHHPKSRLLSRGRCPPRSTLCHLPSYIPTRRLSRRSASNIGSRRKACARPHPGGSPVSPIS